MYVHVFFILLLFRYVNEQKHISSIEQYVIDYVRDLRKNKNLSRMILAIS